MHQVQTVALRFVDSLITGLDAACVCAFLNHYTTGCFVVCPSCRAREIPGPPLAHIVVLSMRPTLPFLICKFMGEAELHSSLNSLRCVYVVASRAKTPVDGVS